MLFQITNTCYENCPHCLHSATDTAQHCDISILSEVTGFFRYLNQAILVLSGGEPTLHPDFLKICCHFNDRKIPFTICSNGTFVLNLTEESLRQQDDFEKAVRLKFCLGAQISTHKLFYRNYERLIEHKQYFESLRNVKFEDTPHIAMMDLGRAKKSEVAVSEMLKERHAPSCINACLIARQSRNPLDFSSKLANILQLCKPLVDFKGNVHMSESMLCPSVGNILQDSYISIFNRMKSFKPCLNCTHNSEYFMSDEMNFKYYQAKKLLEL